MAKNKLSHQTADGKVHTRTTARTYSHVIVAHNQDGNLYEVTNWVGRPDLVSGALAQARRFTTVWTYTAEPLNHGSRPEFSL